MNQLPVCKWGPAISEEEKRINTMEPPIIVGFHVAQDQQIAKEIVAKDQQIAQDNSKGVFIDAAYGAVPKNPDRPTQRISDEDMAKLLAHFDKLTD